MDSFDTSKIFDLSKMNINEVVNTFRPYLKYYDFSANYTNTVLMKQKINPDPKFIDNGLSELKNSLANAIVSGVKTNYLANESFMENIHLFIEYINLQKNIPENEDKEHISGKNNDEQTETVLNEHKEIFRGSDNTNFDKFFTIWHLPTLEHFKDKTKASIVYHICKDSLQHGLNQDKYLDWVSREFTFDKPSKVLSESALSVKALEALKNLKHFKN